MVKDGALSVDAVTYDGRDVENNRSQCLQPNISQQESELCDERRVQSPLFQALRCTDNETSIMDDRNSGEGAVRRLLDTSQTAEGINSSDQATAINHPQDASPSCSTSTETSMREHRGNMHTKADHCLSTARDVSSRAYGDAIYDTHENHVGSINNSALKKFHSKIQERESRSRPTTDSERLQKGKLEWQDFMATASGSSATTRTIPQFPASISTKSMSKCLTHSQSQMKIDKRRFKTHSATLSKKHRQRLVIEQSKSVQTLEAKQTDENISISVDRSVTNLGNHVTQFRRKSQQAKETFCGFYSLGRNFNMEAMLSDLNPSAIQLGFLC